MLTDRQREILRQVVELYVATAEPVGSRHLVKCFRLDVSPATIRNEMSDLEELGFLEQPHSSAGRVPTDRGYRFYVDNLCQDAPREEDRRLLVQLEQDYHSRCGEIRAVLGNAVKILSEVTRLTGLAVGPQSTEQPVRKVQLVGIDSQRILMVVVNASGLVTNHMLDGAAVVPQGVLNRLSDIINDNFSKDAMRRLLSDELVLLKDIESKYRETVRKLLGSLEERLTMAVTEDRLYLEGISLILDQPEFRNYEKARLIVDRFTNQSELSGVLRGDGGPSVQATIGAENQVTALQEFAVVSSAFEVPDGRGAIGVLGPRRMQYARVMALVSWMSRRLTELLQGGQRAG